VIVEICAWNVRVVETSIRTLLLRSAI